MAERRRPGRNGRSASARRRQEKTTVLLVTNGRRTEYAYLRELAARANRARADLHVKAQFIDGAPETVVRRLMSPHGNTDAYDEVWIVVDEDGEDRSRFVADMVRRSTKRRRWQAVVSRPCFEVWLIAHVEQVRSYRDQRDAQRHWAELFPSARESKELPLSFPFDEMGAADARCVLRSAMPRASGDLPPSPGSAMGALISRLGFGEP